MHSVLKLIIEGLSVLSYVDFVAKEATGILDGRERATARSERFPDSGFFLVLFVERTIVSAVL